METPFENPRHVPDGASLAVVTYKYNLKIQGYHVYQEVWTPFLGETLPYSPEDGNPHDPFCVKVTKRDVGTVGHLPITIRSSCSVFLQMGGAISCRVTRSRCYSRDLDQGGLEIPCVLVFQGSNCLVSKAKKMLQLCEQKPYNIKASTAQDTPMEALKDGEDLPENPAKKNLKLKRRKVHQDVTIIMKMFGCITKSDCL